MKIVKVMVVMLIFAGVGIAQAMKPTPSATPGADFDKLKSLVGEWEGTMNEGGKQFPATTSFRTVSDGSVVMSVLGAGTPYEMVTMFHMDNQYLMATHYCAGHNQPRFLLVPSSEPNALQFEFKDATNLPTPGTPHMVGVKIIFVDANHHFQDWTYLEKGQKSTSRFEFHRKA
jgi:hypothetical protein